MENNWRDRLRALRERLKRPNKEASENSTDTQEGPVTQYRQKPLPARPNKSRAQEQLQTVSINLGIDFGTSFTKICFRDVGTEESGIVTFDAGNSDGALIPTVVSVGPNGHIKISNGMSDDQHSVFIPYLKMRLAGSRVGKNLPTVNNVNLNDEESVAALSSWYLASVIIRTMEHLASVEKERFRNRLPVWSANVGVPVEYCDSPELKKFETVLGIAWLWVKENRVPATITELINLYRTTEEHLDDEVTDFHAIPEISAAVQSFIISREAIPGIYVYFDIGGGTVDGVAFRFMNFNGEKKIDFYSGKVDRLGISMLADHLESNVLGGITPEILASILRDANPSKKEDFVQKIRLLVGHVIIRAKDKKRTGWQRPVYQKPGDIKPVFAPLDPSRMEPLDVFIGGGGAPSKWYQKAIISTYEKFQHKNAGIPPYQLTEVPKPADLDMSDIPEEQFRRFAISYGLSVPLGEGPEVRLPSRVPNARKPKLAAKVGIVDYADSKDVYD
jgi:hypothetical protein